MAPTVGNDDDLGPVELGGGLVLRSACAEDVDGIVAVETGAFGPADEPGIRAAMEHGGGPERWAVVVDGDRVVSASVLVDLSLDLAGTVIPAGQVEWVATRPEHQRQGLVRAQFERHHRLARDRGHLVLLIAGIPFVYRRFGYGYGLDYPAIFLLDRETFAARRCDGGVEVRAAAEHDIPAMLALESLRPARAVRGVRDARYFRRRLAATAGERDRYEQMVVATRDGSVCGWTMGKLDDDVGGRLTAKPGVATDRPATDALLGYLLDQAEQRRLVLVAQGAAGSPYGERLTEVGTPVDLHAAYYTRTPDPLALLETLRPVLSARLRSSDAYHDASGTLDISLYNSGIALDYENGTITAIRDVPGVEDPLENIGVGVAPDWFGALVLGRWGALELARRVDDVMLGRHRRIMETLFPKLPSDVAADL